MKKLAMMRNSYPSDLEAKVFLFSNIRSARHLKFLLRTGAAEEPRRDTKNKGIKPPFISWVRGWYSLINYIHGLIIDSVNALQTESAT